MGLFGGPNVEKLEAKRDVDGLGKALTNGDPEVRDAAGRALAGIGGPDAVHAIANRMEGQKDVAGFIQSFTGSHHFVLDYLVEEVLQRQPESVQTFLLRTSILERLCGPLCEAVLADRPASGQETLEAIERANLFIIPLDNERRWYRYHHLFADLLAARALREQAAHIPILHQRASAWYADNGFPADAIRHALAAKDFARAAGLVELAWPAMDGRGGECERRPRRRRRTQGWRRICLDSSSVIR